MAIASPSLLLFAQHGWADTQHQIAALATQVAPAGTEIVAPNLGYVRTWLRIEPLIAAVETIARETIAQYPNTPMRIVGHSMGGLIWLEVLHRHREWWPLVESLVLVASPVGGADLGRLMDPMGLGLGIARDLGANRRAIAEPIAAEIPTLVIAGDVDGGSDGTITVGSTRFCHAHFVCLPGLAHAAMRNHPAVAGAIQQFWAGEGLGTRQTEPPAIVRRLQNVPGMTDAHERDFARSQVWLQLKDGTTIRTWKNVMGIDHVFVACSQGQCLYGGFVGWGHAQELKRVLEQIQQELADDA